MIIIKKFNFGGYMNRKDKNLIWFRGIEVADSSCEKLEFLKKRGLANKKVVSDLLRMYLDDYIKYQKLEEFLD